MPYSCKGPLIDIHPHINNEVNHDLLLFTDFCKHSLHIYLDVILVTGLTLVLPGL